MDRACQSKSELEEMMVEAKKKLTEVQRAMQLIDQGLAKKTPQGWRLYKAPGSPGGLPRKVTAHQRKILRLANREFRFQVQRSGEK
jgi:hypothetical protein